ncbi:hypothetical protein FEM48_Zijuj01G0232700 [Ziziphus jujuba var. spinosa]|uniref:Uncharacterized protein n=1 Tax=Ziziphus jujuba var. spinosa TaxID=714518 RepID=A0A978W448_ZIZJJ|nr:hypothetical protein FEM48_Zijuj01G0232700 [Ziziphus jujuba var. spinosa]
MLMVLSLVVSLSEEGEKEKIVSGKLRLAMFALLHLIGPAVGFANPLRGSRRSTGDAERVRMPCGMQYSKQHSSSKTQEEAGKHICIC